MSFTRARASRIASSCPKDFDFQFFIFQDEGDYAAFLGWKRMLNSLYDLPENIAWNFIILALYLVVVVRAAFHVDIRDSDYEYIFYVVECVANILYAVYLVAIIYNDYKRIQYHEIKFSYFRIFWYILEVMSFAHYYFQTGPEITKHLPYGLTRHDLQFYCYLLRLPRVFKFLGDLNYNYLKGTIFLTLLKYCYIFYITRVILTYVIVLTGMMEYKKYASQSDEISLFTRKCFRGSYIVLKLFVQMRLKHSATTDLDRTIVIFINMIGFVMFAGITISAFSQVVEVHIRPWETFNTRLKLIIRTFKNKNISLKLKEKVVTFYRMYWHKQSAVSSSSLLNRMTPTLQNFILMEMYFEAQQKSRILRDMSFQVLQEVAKVMRTVNYVPGDLISTRGTHKSFMIFIEYGDVEVLTAEDDDTPILRFTRGSIINPCGLAVEVGATQAHVCVRAATFCTAYILHATDFWRVCAKFGRFNAQSYIAHSSFEEHIEAVKKHYPSRKKIPVKYKSSIFVTKRNLLALKEARDGDGRLLLGRADKFIEVAGCYIMRNTASTSLMEDVDVVCLKSTFPCILQPNSPVLIVWQTFVAANTVYIALVYPYLKIYYKTISDTLKFYGWFSTFIYAVDVVVILSTGEKIEEGVPVTLAKTASEQLKNPLILIDIFVAVPFLYLFLPESKLNGLHKLLKLFRVYLLMKKFEEIFIFRRNLLRFLEYAFFMILCIYFVAALKQGLFCYLFQLCTVDNYTNYAFWKVGELDDSDNYHTLVMSVLCSILLITFSDARSKSVGMLSNCIVTALLEMAIVLRLIVNGTYAAIITSMEKSKEDFSYAMKKINKFLDKNNIEKNLKNRLLEYFKLSWHFDEGYKITHREQNFLSDLPKHVFAEVQAEQKRNVLKRLRFWKYLSFELMERVSTNSTLFYCAPNEIILNTGDTISEMYMIRRGFCEVYSPRNKEVVKILGPNANFGDIEMIFRIPVFYSVRAATHVELLSLSKKHLLGLIKSRRFQAAMRYCTQQPEFRGAQRRRETFLHYQPPTPPRSLQRFPVLRKFESDAAFQGPFQRLGFLAVLRYVFPRFTIRPDGPYLRRYEWFRAVCAFLSSLFYPTYGWLSAQMPILEHVSYFLDYSAYFDILQRMLVGYYNEKGILVYHPASTAGHYLSTAFLLDLVASLPFENLDEMRLTIYYDTNLDMYEHPSLYSYLMFNRGIQLYRTVITLGTLKDYIKRYELVLIIQTVPIFLYILSMRVTYILEDTVCLFTKVGEDTVYRVLTTEEVDGEDSHENWMKLFASKTLDFNVTATPWTAVLTSYFFIIDQVTTTCYNYFYPHNIDLVESFIIVMFLITLLVTYIGMRIVSLRSQVDKSMASFQEHMKDTKMFLKKENFCKEIQKEVLSYFAYRWEQTGDTDSRELLKLCDQISLRTDAMLQIFGHTLIRCPVLRHCERTLLRQLGRGLHSEYFTSGMVIIEKEDVIDHMYFVEYGTVAVYCDIYCEDPILITKLPRGSVFGNIGNHTIALCNNRFMVTENAHLLVIKTNIFYKIIQDYPKIQSLLVKYRPNNENYIIGVIAGTTKVMSTWKERALSSAINAAVSHKGVEKFFKIFLNKTNAGLIYLFIVTYCSIIATIYNCVFYEETNRMALIIFYGLDVLFLLKLVVNYLVIYFFGVNEGERSVLSNVNKRRFIREYKHDLISVVPFEVFALLDKQHPWLTFGMLRINRLFRVSCMKKSLSKYQQRLSINMAATAMATGVLWFFLMIHFLACSWYLLACYIDNKHPKTSWRHQIAVANKTFTKNGYFHSFYTMLSLFLHVGHEELRGKTQIEIFFMAVLMVLSSMVFMIFVGEFSNIIQFVNFRVMEYYSEKLECEKFLEGKFIAPALVDRVNKYILYLWREQRGLQMPHFVATAPMCVRNKVMATAYMSHLVQHSIFGECEASFLRQLVGCFRVYTYLKGMYVVKEGEVTDAMYFVHKGSIQEIAEDYEEELLDFEAGHHFGTFNGINPNSPFNYTYKTKTRATVLHLYFDDWKYLLDHFPASQNIILTNQNQDKDYDIGIKQKVKKKDVEKPESERPLLRFASARGNLSRLDSETMLEETEIESKPLTPIKSARKSALPAQSFKEIPRGRESGDEYTIRSAAESSAPSTELSINWPSFTRHSITATGPTYNKRDSEDENKKTEAEQPSSSSQLIDVPSPDALNTHSSETVEMDNLGEKVVEEESYVIEDRRRKSSVHFEKLSTDGTAAKPFEGKRSSIAEVEIDSIDYSKQVTKKEKDSSTTKTEDILKPKETLPDVPADKPDVSRRKSDIEKSDSQEHTKLLESTEEGNAMSDDFEYIALLPSQSGLSLLETQPAPVVPPDIFIDFIDDINSMKQRSVLSFKDEVETVEIPIDKDHDTPVKDLKARETEQIQSMMSFTGDIALKERMEEIEEILKMQDNASSTSVKSIASASDSQWSVEGYMMHDAGESRQRDRSPSSLTSLVSVASRSKSIESTASELNEFVTVTKKEKKGLVWKEEDALNDATTNKAPAWLQGTVLIDMLDDDDLEQEDKGKKKHRRH